MRHSHFVVFDELFRLAALAEGVMSADEFHGGRALTREHFGYRAAESPRYLVLFHGDDRSRRLRFAQNSFFVERFYRVHIYDRDRNSLFLELARGEKRVVDERPRRKYRDLRRFALPEHIRLPYFERRLGSRHDGRLVARPAHIDGFSELRRSDGRLPAFLRIARRDDREVRE